MSHRVGMFECVAFDNAEGCWNVGFEQTTAQVPMTESILSHRFEE